MDKPWLHHFRCEYEKAGLRVDAEAVPWNADAVLVHARVSLSPARGWHNSDFELRASGWYPLIAISLVPCEEEDVFEVHFRCPPFQRPMLLTAFCRGNFLGQIRLAYLSADAFLKSLHVEGATAVASLGKLEVPCSTVVEGQSHNFIATAILSSCHSLLPLVDFNLAAEFHEQTTHRRLVIRPRLNAAQLKSRQACLCATIGHRFQVWRELSVRWRVEDRALAHCEIRAISKAAFQESLYVVESRYLYQEVHGALAAAQHLSPPEGDSYPRPCFLLASRELGVAGICPLEVHVHFRQRTRPSMVLRKEMVIMDGPSLFSPVIPVKGEEIRGFELFSQGRLLGALGVGPAPVATFTKEGGFKATEDYAWTAWAEDELVDRLHRLMDTEAKAVGNGVKA
jgi:hypothetical protein